MNFNYLFQQGPDHYVDVIEASGGTIFFRCQNDSGRAVSYSGPSNNYRAVHSTLIFGALQEITNTRNELMARYMNYLTGLINLDDNSNCNLNTVELTVFPNPFRFKTRIFCATIPKNKVAIKIYNNQGNLVKNDLVQTADGYFIWDGKDNLGRAVSAGIYFVHINIGSDFKTKAIVKTK
ncbi:MAG: T9SS type A sorting domain-containing protein [candidate division WOR-3 bacterium]